MSELAVGSSTRDREAAVSASGVRGAVNIVLAVLASVAALAGGLALYARSEIVDPSAFGDHAVQAVQQPVLRRVIAREITAQAIEPSLPDVIAARPVVQSAVQEVIGSEPFRPIIRLAAEHGHSLLFERGGGNAAFDIADAGTVVGSALQSLAPMVARAVPRRTNAVLLSVRRRSLADTTLRVSDHVCLLGIVLPVAALALFALIILTARDRRVALARSAIAVAITGIAFMVAFELVRRYVISHSYGAHELTNADVRGAVGELWDVYLGDMMTWALVITVAAVLIAAAARSVARALFAGDELEAMARPRSAGGVQSRARGAERDLPGTRDLRDPTFHPGGRGAGDPRWLRPGLRGGRGATDRHRPGAPPGSPGAPATAAPSGYGGGVGRCPNRRDRRRLSPDRRDRESQGKSRSDVQRLPAAMQPAAGRGGVRWNAQLDVGRGLAGVADRKSGPHHSPATPGWHQVVQDLHPLRRRGLGRRRAHRHRRLRTAPEPGGGQALPGRPLGAAAPSRALTAGSFENRKRDIWLCHTLCELGATRMVDFLSTIRSFLERNPDQVIILFGEDYATEPDLQSVFQRAGLFRYLDTLQPGQPLPTLGALIRSRHNVLVFAQKPTSGNYRWDMDGFEWIQDTPLGATKPAQFTCRLYRGQPSNPLLMMNDWADTFPPRLTPNLPLVRRAFILSRARQCIAQRGRTPNLILTDYYNRGDVVGAAAELNGVGGERPAPTAPWS